MQLIVQKSFIGDYEIMGNTKEEPTIGGKNKKIRQK